MTQFLMVFGWMLIASSIGLAVFSALGSSAHEAVTVPAGAGTHIYYSFSRLTGPLSLRLSLVSSDGPVDACLFSDDAYKRYLQGADPAGTCVHAGPAGSLDYEGGVPGPLRIVRFYVVVMHSRGFEGQSQRVHVDMDAPGLEATSFLAAMTTGVAGAFLLVAVVVHARRKDAAR